MSTGAPAAVAWSGGKDAAWALKRTLDRGCDVLGLMVVLDQVSGTSCLNRVPLNALEEQARALGLMLWCSRVPNPASESEYGRAMHDLCQRVESAGVRVVVFGDISLQGIREYRADRLLGTGLEPVFPLWGTDSRELAHEMIDGGLKARVTAATDPRWIGRDYDHAFINSLDVSVDPCGERGEFHTMVYDAPMFASPIGRAMPPTLAHTKAPERNE